MVNSDTPKAPKTVEEVIAYLENALDEMRRDDTPDQLAGIDPDTAFELGYETAIFDLRHAADVPEMGIIEFEFQKREEVGD
jgi:hypothetical protein